MLLTSTMADQPPRRFARARAAVFTVRVWRETFDPPGLMKTDWAWFDDAHEESHDEYHVADRGEILSTVAAWIDRFLNRPEVRSGTHEREQPSAGSPDPPNIPPPS